jgi:hypothetical protein
MTTPHDHHGNPMTGDVAAVAFGLAGDWAAARATAAAHRDRFRAA